MATKAVNASETPVPNKFVPHDRRKKSVKFEYRETFVADAFWQLRAGPALGAPPHEPSIRESFKFVARVGRVRGKAKRRSPEASGSVIGRADATTPQGSTDGFRSVQRAAKSKTGQ